MEQFFFFLNKRKENFKKYIYKWKRYTERERRLCISTPSSNNTKTEKKKEQGKKNHQRYTDLFM